MRYSVSDIAKQLKRYRSTISWEIKRNSGPRSYHTKQADRKATERRSKVSRKPKKMTSELRERIINGIKEGWAPEQVSGYLKLEGTLISHESIYKIIREDKEAGGNLYKHLRHRGKG
jgi:IS30 family transposase